jgi:hypothetical protein
MGMVAIEAVGVEVTLTGGKLGGGGGGNGCFYTREYAKYWLVEK